METDKENEKLMQARKIFESGYNCCQAVFTPFAVEIGLTEEASLKISSGFGGGMSYNGETCGAVVGAHLAIGLLNNQNNPFNTEAKEKVKNQIQQFRESFNLKHGTCICSELLGANPKNADELEYLRQNNIFKQKCPGYVDDTVKMLNDLLR